MAIVGSAQRRLAAADIDQWQNGYPNRERIEQDIRASVGRVLCVEDSVVAYGAVVYTGESAYDALQGGQWLSEGDYATIHRVCVAQSAVGRGIGRLFMECAESEARERGVASIRVDTHPDNRIMQSLLSSLSYTYCGTVVYESLRLAYEKLMVESL